jgi:hypothetical protein
MGRIPMQLFVGPKEGYLAMAIAYAQYFCAIKTGKTGSNEACNLKFQKHRIQIYTLLIQL